jgi:uncharacterized repeat protein (TIGR03803 family)
MEAKRRKLGLSKALALAAVGLSLCLSAHGEPKYKILHSFNGNDGSGPYGGVILDLKGTLFGTASGGGPCGTVFELSPQKSGEWKETVLYQFHANDDGCDPWSSVILDPAGNLYATTVGGGTYLAGTVFELTSGADGWTETILYNFGTHSDDGGNPTAGLVMDESGNLYGTTPKGGTPTTNGGTLFELTPGSGGSNETVLYRFCVSMPVCEDGGAPSAGLILDAAGNLYGTTGYGGTGCVGEGCGTVYELTPVSGGGWNETVLHRFHNNGKDGYTPGSGAVLMDGSGSLYGTTEVGGTIGYGTVFRLTPGPHGRWKEIVIYDFKPGASGWFPGAGVVMDKAGNLYGTTDSGGEPFCDCGVIYKLAPGPKGKWTYTVLHEFGIGDDGGVPAGNLVMDTEGNLYGGTVLGGAYGIGVIFELTP